MILDLRCFQRPPRPIGLLLGLAVLTAVMPNPHAGWAADRGDRLDPPAATGAPDHPIATAAPDRPMATAAPDRPAASAIPERPAATTQPLRESAAAPMQRPRIGLVLGGGGARGVSEIGVLQTLERLHVPVDAVVGTSMGSIVGGAYGMGITPDDMEQRLQHVNWDEVVQDAVPRSQRSVLSKELERDNIRAVELGFRDGRIRLPKGAVAGHEFELFLTQLLGAAPFVNSFDELPIPYRAVATDIETGNMVVLDHGDVVGSIRASMAVPGVFAPVELDGHLLVDGGLTRNLPVDVARRMGVDRLIVVDVGSQLMKRGELSSAIAVSQQMLNILGRQNVDASLSQLRPGDVLIKIDLGNFSVADFEHSTATIATGRAAAMAQAGALEGLRLDDVAWAQHLAQRSARRELPPETRALHVDNSLLHWVNPKSVEALMESREGEPISPAALDRDLRRLYATDDFQQIRARAVSLDDGSTEVVVQPIEKEWGPNYVNLDLDLSTDLQGNSKFSARVATRSTWLDARGLEWRNSFSLGAVNEWISELYQPLDFSRSLFIAPRIELHQERDDLYQQNSPVTTYQINRQLAAVDLGVRFGTSGLLRVGLENGDSTATPALAEQNFPTDHQHIGVIHVRLDLDTLDRWAFPSEGHYVHADFKNSREVLGANTNYNRGDLQLEQAFHYGDQDLILGLSGGSGFGTQLPVQDLFPLGGFLQLSGYQQRQFLGQSYVLGRVITYHSLGDPGALTRRLFVGGSLEAGDVYERFNGSNEAGLRHSGSLFLGADTGIGPLFIGVGVAGNSRSAYLFLGRP